MMAAIVRTWESIANFPVFNEGDPQGDRHLLESGSELRSESPLTARANLPHPAVLVGVLCTEICVDPQPRCLASYVRNVDPVLVGAA